MVIFRVILMLLAFVVVLVLALTNSQTMTNAIVFNKTYYDVPVAFVMLYSFAFGALCVGIFTLVSEIQLRSRLYRQKKAQDALMEELRALRNAPLEGEYPPKPAPDRPESANGGA
ncbi:MAG: LapA family protein [candidate division WOR-3 bacterium]|nr:LapA family protein [candidate division WOR-3 bacterium]